MGQYEGASVDWAMGRKDNENSNELKPVAPLSEGARKALEEQSAAIRPASSQRVETVRATVPEEPSVHVAPDSYDTPQVAERLRLAEEVGGESSVAIKPTEARPGNQFEKVSGRDLQQKIEEARARAREAAGKGERAAA